MSDESGTGPEKLDLTTPNFTDQNIARIAELFPNVVTESRDEDGKLKHAIDFDALKQELSDNIVEGPQERYQLNWPGKRDAMLAANAPINKTLRPCREESVDFDTTKNLFIEGDNLDALKLLQETYLGKVKMIYIDPPYNTGKDFIYKDNFSVNKDEYLEESGQRDEEGGRLVANPESYGRYHSDWLSMMFGRLKLARNLLSDDGVILVSIDEKEHSNLIKVCDEIFGRQNFCGEVIWKNSSKNDQDYISMQHEYFVAYVRDKAVNGGDWKEKKAGLEEIYKAFRGFKSKFGMDREAIHAAALNWYGSFPASNPIKDSKHYSWMDDRGVYFPDNIAGPNDGQYVYDVKHPTTKEVCKPPATGWRFPESTMKTKITDKYVHFGVDHTTVPNNKTYLKNTEFQSLTSMRYVDGRAASKRLKSLFDDTKVFTNPKDEFLLQDFFSAMGVTDTDIVVDFFAGSGSTAHAVMAVNSVNHSSCTYISVQISEDLNDISKTATGGAKKVAKNAIKFLEELHVPTNIAEISKERIRRTGKKILEENPDQVGKLDVGFRVLKIESSNMTDVWHSPEQVSQDDLLSQVSNIKSDRTAEDLLFQVLLDWGVDLTLPIARESIEGKEVFFVDDNALAACFDTGVSEELVKQIAQRKPLRVVFRDDGFDNDATKINVEQLFKHLSPHTEMKVI